MENTTFLTIIQYDSSADQSFLVMNSENIFNYFEDYETGSNAMIAILNAIQKETLLSKGYIIQVVEENPQMEQYVFLENELPNQARNVASLGKVYALTQNHTLVRLNDGTSYENSTPEAGFKEIPLTDIRPNVATENSIDLNNLTTTSITPTPTITPSGLPTYLIISIIIVGTLILAIVSYFVWKGIKNKEPDIS